MREKTKQQIISIPKNITILRNLYNLLLCFLYIKHLKFPTTPASAFHDFNKE
jgi:hypothetical protein